MHGILTKAGLALALCSLAFPATSLAADLEVQISDSNGVPVAGAVVSAHLVGQPTPRPRAAGTFMIDQQNIQFHPFITTVPIGASVLFMNHDALRHHVYSFAKAKRFELKLTGKQQNQAVIFDKPGIVPLGCNIHDRMIAYVDVVDTPWAKTADANGRAILRGLPPGAVSVSVWHPYLRAPGNVVSRTVPVGDATSRRERFVAALRPVPRSSDLDH